MSVEGDRRVDEGPQRSITEEARRPSLVNRRTILIAATLVATVIVALVVVMAVHSANGSHQSTTPGLVVNQTATTSAPSAKPATVTSWQYGDPDICPNLALQPESLADRPIVVMCKKETVYAYAYASGDQRYLDHFFARHDQAWQSISDYLAMYDPRGGVILHLPSYRVVSVATPTSFVGEVTDQVNSFDPQTHTIQYDWVPSASEWRATFLDD